MITVNTYYTIGSYDYLKTEVKFFIRKGFHRFSKSKSLLFIAFMLVLSKGIQGQEIYRIPNHEVQFSPSPDAASLGKYGQYPVEEFTGIPNINIPIYKIDQNNLSVNISLSYHASGFRVNERASSVGLGWALNAGGVITRSVKGMADSDIGGFLTQNVPSAHELTLNPDYEYVRYVSDNKKDTQSDVYFYNFNGHSGKFMIGSDKEPFTIPYAPIKIEFINGITITDEFGLIYIFSNTETSLATPPQYSGDPAVSTSFVSSWFLTTIIDPNRNDSIKFTYQPGLQTIEYYDVFKETIGKERSDGPIVHHTHPIVKGSNKISTKVLDEIRFKNGTVKFQYSNERKDGSDSGMKLEKIDIKKINLSTGIPETLKTYELKHSYFETPGGAIENHQTYHKRYNPIHYRIRLDGILLKDGKDISVGEYNLLYDDKILPVKTSNSQDYWGFYNGANNASLIKSGNDGDVWYNNHLYHVYDADRSSNPDLITTGMLKQIKYPTGGHTDFEFEPHGYVGQFTIPKRLGVYAEGGDCIGSGIDRSVDVLTFTPYRNISAKLDLTVSKFDINGQQVFTLPFVKIEDLTTGNVVIEYNGLPDRDQNVKEKFGFKEGHQYRLTSEAHDVCGIYSAIGVTWSDYGEKVISGAGVRIKTIKNFEDNGILGTSETYKYREDESGGGQLVTPQHMLSAFSYTQKIIFGLLLNEPPYGCLEKTWDILTYTGAPVYDLGSIAGSHVTYSEVAKYLGDENDNLGKTVKTYSNNGSGHYPVVAEYERGVYSYDMSWNSGHLMKEIQYDAFDFENPASKIDYKYTTLNSETHYGLIIGRKVSRSGCMIYGDNTMFNDFYWFDYPIKTGLKKMSEKNVLVFDQSNPTSKVATSYKLAYDNLQHLQVTSETKNTSLGQVSTHYKYPQDYNLSQNSNPLVTQLIEANMIAYPLESIKMVNGLTVKASAVEFENEHNLLQPKNFYSLETKQPIIGFIGSSDGRDFAPYKLKAKILKRDHLTGNILCQQSENNIITSYIWGYGGSYPIVQVDNLHYDDIPIATRNKLESLIFTENTISDCTTLNLELDALRNNQNVEVTSYTYDLLIGVTSRTEPNGLTTYFEYDDFGRLKYVKDHDRNILKEHEYQYANKSN